jgi:outer membrane protein assembly factor BamB
MALGPGNIYFGTGLGSVYAIKQSDGTQVWKKSVSPAEFLTTPIVTGNGLLYIQDADDIVYCIKQSDGTVVWECNCLDYGPIYGKGGGRKVDFFPGNPTICPNGDIIVVGEEALYCVAGYTAGTLAATPWPKWQHDLHNTGRVGGGW